MPFFGLPYQGQVTNNLYTATAETIDLGYTPTATHTLMERPGSAPDHSAYDDPTAGKLFNQRFLLDRGRLPDYHWVYIDSNDVPWLMYATFSAAGTPGDGNNLTATVNVFVACRFGEFENRELPTFDDSKVTDNVHYSIDHLIGTDNATLTSVDLHNYFDDPKQSGFSPNPRGDKVMLSWKGYATEDVTAPYQQQSVAKRVSGITEVSISGAFDRETQTGLSVSHSVLIDCDVAMPPPFSNDYGTGQPYPTDVQWLTNSCYLGGFYDEDGNRQYITFEEKEDNTNWSSHDGTHDHIGYIKINGRELVRVHGHSEPNLTTNPISGHQTTCSMFFTDSDSNETEVCDWEYDDGATQPTDAWQTWQFKNNPVDNIEFMNDHSDRLFKVEFSAQQPAKVTPADPRMNAYGTAHNLKNYGGYSCTTLPLYIAYDPRTQTVATDSTNIGFI